MLLSQKRLRQILGVLWLIDGLLQLQPAMFTMNMVNKVMDPTAVGQPGPIAASLNWIIAVTTHNLIAINLLIVVVQVILGVLLIAGFWVRGTVIASIVWALIVWYGGGRDEYVIDRASQRSHRSTRSCSTLSPSGLCDLPTTHLQ
jgi:uncharacterized membrane protein YphA (DoxX/SURF4 family)